MSARFDGEYPASTSKALTMIPSQEERNAFSRKELILVNVASLVKHASSASTYEQICCINNYFKNNKYMRRKKS